MIEFDYNSILDRLKENLSTKSEHANILYESTNQKILEVIAQEDAYEAQYDEYLTRENQWGIARNISSLLTQASILNYKANRMIGATGTLKVSYSETFDAPPPVTIDIPKYTQFSTEEGIIYSAIDSYQITTANDFIEIEVVQGIPTEFTSIALGTEFESFSIENEGIENSLYEFFVNDILLEEVDSLFSASSSDYVYQLNNKFSFEGVTIDVGNDIFGKKLQSNDEVVFKYIVTLGKSGNIFTIDAVNKVDSVVYNIDNASTEIFCTNESSISGGAEVETLEEIRENAPKFFQSGDRASSIDDYETILESFSYIKKVSIWGAYETLLDSDLDPFTFIPSEENVVHISAINEIDEQISSAQELLVLEDINSKKAPTDLLSFEEVEFINLNWIVSAHVSNPSYTLPTVKSSIVETLETSYDLDTLDFNESIRYSDYISLIDGVEGVDYHDTEVFISYFALFEDSVATSSAILTMIPLTPLSIKVYLKEIVASDWLLIGEDDGTNNIEGVDVYDLTNSEVDYTTGETVVVINDFGATPAEYELKIDYYSEEKNLICPSRSSILRYYSSEVTASYEDLS